MRTLIVEDEPNAVVRLSKFLHDLEPEVEILDCLDGITATVDWFREHPPPDLLFLDIHLSDGNCFEIFEQYPLDLPVIFTTAYDEYALRSFNYHSLDYLLKPLKKADLQRALDKFRKVRRGPGDDKHTGSVMETQPGLRRLLVKVGPKINLIKISEVAYFYSYNKITFAITSGGRRFPIDKSLEQMETLLQGLEFFRINRQFIIHIDAIDNMMSYSKGRVKINLKPACDMETIVSTERSPHFKRWLRS